MDTETKTTEKMITKTTQNIENELVKIKNNLTFAKHFELLCNAYMNKDQYQFMTLAGNYCELFENKLFFCGDFDYKIHNVKHFEEMYKICFDKKIENNKWIEAIKSFKYVIKNIEFDGNKEIAYDICNELMK